MCLTKVQEQVRDRTRSLADRMVRPATEALDREKGLAGDISDKMTKLCRFAISGPKARCSGIAVHVPGGLACSRGCAVDRLYRDTKITQICDGTRQVRRRIIALELMKKGARR
jgi:alkylation response protein AidB-like acyl-CoA dehydrogenase